MRYIYFVDPKYRKSLKVPEIPFTEIDKIGAGMYKGENVSREERHAKLSESQIAKENEQWEKEEKR